MLAPQSSFDLVSSDLASSYPGLSQPDSLQGQQPFQLGRVGLASNQFYGATIHSQSGNVQLTGDRYNNRLQGKTGNDVLRGNGGNDVLLGRAGADRLYGNNGQDRLGGGGGNDRLWGGSGKNTLLGHAGQDQLVGGKAIDRLVGGAGDDMLTGGGSNDRITGGTGRDRFVLNAKWMTSEVTTAAIITDFKEGEDTLQLVGINFDQVTLKQGEGTQLGNTLIQEISTGKVLAILAGATLNSPDGTIDVTDFTPTSTPTPIPTPPSPLPTPIPTPTPTPTPTPGTGSLTFRNTSYRVSEGIGLATITVDRTGGNTGSITVDYSISNNTAVAGQDFTTTSGTLTFNADETSKTFTVPILQDSNFETAEVLRLSLSNPTNGGTLGTNTKALLTITNDDDPTEAQIQAKAASSTTFGGTTFYIGYNQVSTGTDIGNQDPWIASFSNGTLNWYRDDYEITMDDSRGTHLLWDNNTNSLYAAFTSTGTQGTAAEDFRRFATQGWLRSYSDYSPGGGGGAKVAILAKLNSSDGSVTNASFLTSLNGTKTNSLSVKSLSLNGSNLVVQADSAFAPRKPDRTAMTSTGATATSPNYTVEFAPDLGSVISTVSTNYI